MRRPLTISLLAIALLLATPTAAAASIYVQFPLAANNGLHANISAFQGEVTLEIVRKGSSVTYQARGQLGEAGLKAKFGKLGSIEVAFQPTRTLDIQGPPKRCEGEPSTEREGIFVGTIEFAGEDGYVQIEQARTQGEMSVHREDEWRCPRGKEPKPPGASPRRSPIRSTQQLAVEEEATLTAFDRRCRCALIATTERNPKGRGVTILAGGKTEHREGMRINRVTLVRTGSSAFVFDHTAGTALVRPPQPFSGSGTFERRRGGTNLWRSTIRVPLLGIDPIRISGRGYKASLNDEFVLD